MSDVDHGIIHPRSQGLIDYACSYAAKAHEGQGRNTFDPYIVHPIAVAKLVASVTQDCDMICAALLHDVVEDTPITIQQIDKAFGFRCASFVLGLTEFSLKSDGNRATRKALDARYLGRQSAQVQTIKVADLIDNTSSIVEHDPDFAKRYMREKRELLTVLTKADIFLLRKANRIVENFFTDGETE